MNKEEFLGKLQMCYFGERNAFDEIVSEFDRLNNIINELEKYINKNIEMTNSAITFNRDITKDKYEMLKYGRDATLFEMILDKLKELKEGNK